jgi:hypothetical protein
MQDPQTFALSKNKTTKLPGANVDDKTIPNKGKKIKWVVPKP